MNLIDLYIKWDVNPVLFEIGNIAVYYYSIFMLLAMFLSIMVLKKVYEQNQMSWGSLQIFIVLTLTLLFLGARIGHCLIYEPGYYLSRPLEILLPVEIAEDGQWYFIGYNGVASHGGIVGLIIAILIYIKITGYKLIRILDCIALVLPLGAGIIRIGNLFNSEILGLPSTVPWAFIFMRVDSVPRHPTQIYEAVTYLLIFFFIMKSYKKEGFNKFPGFICGLSLTLIFTFRFLLEFLKEEQVDAEKFMLLDYGQILSIPLIIMGIVMILLSKKKVFI